jgi:arylsulfatase A-like enzyme
MLDLIPMSADGALRRRQSIAGRDLLSWQRTSPGKLSADQKALLIMTQIIANTPDRYRTSCRRCVSQSITKILVLASLAGIPQLSWTSRLAAESSEQPNIVLIMADDLGYGDLSCYAGDAIKTPVLDQLASEGIRLTSFYAGCTVCTPSRMALLTGAYPARVGWRGGVVGYGVKPVNGLAPEALTIAEVFQAAGYATALCGKWHLGDARSMLPTNQGFTYTYYITKSNNQTKQLYRGTELIEDPFDNRRLTEQFTAAAIDFIQTNQDKPFFLYVPFTAPHFPAQAHPDFKGRSELGAYGDVVEELDSRIGQILQSLKECGLDEKTCVVFTSDNGPEPGQKKWARAKPFRGLKWSSLEGGNRVPCLVRWPGVIPAGQVSSEITAAIDMLPTLAHGCGIDLAKVANDSPKLDGVNVWNTWIGKPEEAHARRDLLYWDGWAAPQAIRVGDWKLYFDRVKEVPGTAAGPVLINLAEDPTEQTDLRNGQPDRVRALKELAIKRLADIEQQAIPLGGPVDNSNATQKRAQWLE